MCSDTGPIKHVGCEKSAFSKFQPLPAHKNVDLSTIAHVGVACWDSSPYRSGEDGFDNGCHHVMKICYPKVGPIGDAPEIDLVGCTHVRSVDGVSPLDEARHDNE